MVQVESRDDENAEKCWVNDPHSNKRKTVKQMLGESVKKYSLDKIDLITAQKKYFENEDRRAQEKHDADELRAQQKHQWEQVLNELKIKKLKMEIDNLKKVNIGNIFLPLRGVSGVNIGKININKF